MRVPPLLLACALLLPQAHAAAPEPAGTLQRATGDVWIYSRTQRAKPFGAGGAFESGVSVATGPRSSAVLRFRDGQVIGLAPNTTLRVKEYAFEAGAPAQGRVGLELVKGGVHCVTGAIGAANHGGWLLEMPDAQLTVAGTDFLAVAQFGSYARVKSGAVTLANDAGAVNVPAGGTAVAAADGGVPTLAGTVADSVFAEAQAVDLGTAAGAAATGGGAAASTGVSALAVGVGVAAIAAGAAALAASGSSDTATTTHH